MTPPKVSSPRLRGVTSSRSTSFTSPAKTPPCKAAPSATTSSGFTLLFGSLPVSSFTTACTIGILVEPPTKTTSSNSLVSNLASWRARRKGVVTRLTNCSVNCSNFDRLSVICRCFGPLASAVINGRFISVCITLDSSIFAFSAASLTRCRAWRSLLKSTPWSRRNSLVIQSTMAKSQSSPPRWVSPFVAITSTKPSLTSKIDTSKVPPPKSKTRIVSSFFLSRP